MTEQGETMSADIVVTDAIGLGFGAIESQISGEQEARDLAAQAVELRRDVTIADIAICIDGRSGEFFGPHVAGGAMTLLVGADAAGHPYRGTRMLEYASSQGFNLGAHCDDTNKSAGFVGGTGCGANDKMPEIGINFSANKESLGEVVQSLMQSDFDEEVYSTLHLPETDSSEWDKNFLRNAVGEEKTETLHDDGEGVHGHKEQLVIFNFKQNSTIDRDAFVKATGKQIFVVDVWYIKELANRLSVGADSDSQSKIMYHAMMAYQAATYITLCNGSHRAVVIN
ncbi:MAG: hypothetical protein M3Q36_00830 [bacterium]|nr:hypothetical protein [bacterium]